MDQYLVLDLSSGSGGPEEVDESGLLRCWESCVTCPPVSWCFAGPENFGIEFTPEFKTTEFTPEFKTTSSRIREDSESAAASTKLAKMQLKKFMSQNSGGKSQSGKKSRKTSMRRKPIVLEKDFHAQGRFRTKLKWRIDKTAA